MTVCLTEVTFIILYLPEDVDQMYVLYGYICIYSIYIIKPKKAYMYIALCGRIYRHHVYASLPRCVWEIATLTLPVNITDQQYVKIVQFITFDLCYDAVFINQS